MIRFPAPRSRFPVLIYLVWGLAFCGEIRAANPEDDLIRYEISLTHPEQHLFHVTMTIPHVEDQVLIRIPAWNALYQIRDFSSHIQQVEVSLASEPGAASVEGQASIEKIDKQTWRIKAHGTVRVRYATYWDEPGPFATQLNREHAFINPAMILMYLPERRSDPVQEIFADPPGVWQASGPGIQLSEAGGGARAFSGRFANYDALADAPIEVGKFEEFQLSGVTPEIWIIVHGDNWKKQQVESELKRICQYEIKLMEQAPYQRYTFILHIGKGAAGAGGGMEHADGTAINVPSGDNLANVAAHEFFHLWNVKRIRPATLDPVNYSAEQYTRALWFAEGVTNTYASYTLERTGLWSKPQFFHDLGQQITELEMRPANHWQSAEQSSLDAWLEKYPLYEDADNSTSYYTKGQILGVLLDILMREHSDNAAGLDDLLRTMNREFAMAGKTYRDSLDVQLTAEKLAGGSFEEFFKRYVAGASPLPYRATLQLAGLELRETVRKRAALGFSADVTAGGTLIVRSVEASSPAATAGLQSGDVVVKWNGAEPSRRAAEWLRQRKAGETLHLRIRREGSEVNLDFRVGESSETYYDIVEDPHPGEKALRIREGLLHGTTTAATIHAAN